MKLGSLFDGIGGFPYSASKLGITPVWASDAAKYKAIGNSVAIPCVDYVMGGIARVLL